MYPMYRLTYNPKKLRAKNYHLKYLKNFFFASRALTFSIRKNIHFIHYTDFSCAFRHLVYFGGKSISEYGKTVLIEESWMFEKMLNKYLAWRLHRKLLHFRQGYENMELFLVRIFLYSDWKRRFTPYLETFHAVIEVMQDVSFGLI